MDRKRVLVFGVAVICALILATTASSMGGGSEGGGAIPSFVFETGLLGDLMAALQFDAIPLIGQLAVLRYLPGLIAVGIVVVGSVWYLEMSEYATLGFLALLGLVAMALVSFDMTNEPLGGDDGGSGPELWRAAVESGSEITVMVTPIVVVLLLGGGAIAVFALTGNEETADTSTEPVDFRTPEDIEALGNAAGRAAEQLEEEASFENAIYGAWREMVAALPVENPETTTPGEFAELAVTVGMAEPDVKELTDLFEAVRYGNTPVTDERRQRAQAALERIEAEYAGEQDG